MVSLLTGPRQAVVVNGLAVAALVAAALVDPPWVGVLLGLADLVVIAFILRRSLLNRGRPGAWGIARTALIGSVFVSMTRGSSDWWDSATAAAGAALLLLIAFEAKIGGIWSGGTRHVTGLPGIDMARPYTRRAGWVQLTTLVATGCCVLAPTAPVLGIVALVLTVGIGLVVFGWTVRARRDRAQVDPAIQSALESYAAPVMVYLSGPTGTEYQFRVWVSDLEQIVAEGTTIVVVVRESSLASRVSELTTIPVVAAPSLTDLENVHVASFRVALYVNNGAKNGHNVRYRDLTHVQLLHGDSDKPSSYNPVTAMFDRIFVAGQAGIDRYGAHGVQIPEEKFVIVGRPQVAGIAHATSRGPEPRTVFYGPTWAGFNQDNSFGSLEWGEQIVRGLVERGYRVVFRPHPYSLSDRREAAYVARINDLLAADSAASARDHLFGEGASTELTLVDCFNASDALVSDVSSVPADYLYSGKPFVITQVDNTPVDEFLTEFPLGRAAYLARLHEPGSLDVALDALGEDRLASQRDATRRYYLGDIPRETYARAFRDAVRAVVSDAGAGPVLQNAPGATEDELWDDGDGN